MNGSRRREKSSPSQSQLSNSEVTAFPEITSEKTLSDVVALADDLALQAMVIARAYADGRKEEIDFALFSVIDARRMKVTGIIDWFRDEVDGSERELGGAASPCDADVSVDAEPGFAGSGSARRES